MQEHRGIHDLKVLTRRPAAGTFYECVSAALRKHNLNAAKAELFEAGFDHHLHQVSRFLGGVPSYSILVDVHAWATYDAFGLEVTTKSQVMQAFRESLWELMTGHPVSHIQA